jgi:hypothetical protein
MWYAIVVIGIFAAILFMIGLYEYHPEGGVGIAWQLWITLAATLLAVDLVLILLKFIFG